MQERDFINTMLAYTVNICGSDGSAVNEKQLILTFSKKVKYTIIVTLIPLSSILRARYCLKELYSSCRNCIIIPIPGLYAPVLLGMLYSAIVSFIIGLLARIKNVKLIYVRASWFATGILAVKSLKQKVVVKMPAIIEDELTENNIIEKMVKRVTALIAHALDKYVLLKADAVCTNSRSFYNMLVKRRGVMLPQDKCIACPPGIVYEEVEQVKQFKTFSRKKDEIVIGFLGLLTWWQGIDILVKACSLLKDRLQKVRLLIVGDGPMRPLVERLCHNYNVPCEITGFVPHDEALKLLTTFDVLALPSIRTSTTESNIPIKVIEAWALGIPVIVTRHRVFQEEGYRDMEHIVFCEPDPRNVAEKILLVLTNEELRKRLIENGQKVAKKYSYDEIIENILKVLV